LAEATPAPGAGVPLPHTRRTAARRLTTAVGLLTVERRTYRQLRCQNRGSVSWCMSRPFGSASALEQRRRQAVRAVQAGDSVKDVARIIGVQPRSVQRWLQLAQHTDGLAAKPHPGPAPRLSVAQQQQLDQLLRQGAQAHGWPNQLWTTQRIADVIRRHFGVTLHHDHVGRFLRQRLHWSPQKPRRRARERDEQAIAQWKRDTFPDILEAAADRDAHVVFVDE